MKKVAVARGSRASFSRSRSAWSMRMVASFATFLLLATASLLWSVTATAQSTTASLIVKLVPGLTTTEQAAVIARNGGTETSSVPALRLHVVQVPADQLDATLAKYQGDAQVTRAEVNKQRRSDAIPSDPLYSSQWALPKIGWDQ